MTSRERVYTALDHREPDRVPICFGGTPATAIEECPPDHCGTTNLYRYLGLDDTAPIRLAPVCNVVTNIDERCLVRLHSDIRLVTDNPSPPVAIDPAHKLWPHHFGGRITRCGMYDQIDFTDPPMAHMTTDRDIEAYPYWPDADADIMYRVVEKAKRLHEQTDFFVCGALSSGHFPLNGYGLLSGMDKWLMDMKIRPKFYHRLCEKFMDHSAHAIDVFYGEVGAYLDGAVVYDDLGFQTGPIMSLADYREFYRPYQAETITRIRKHLRPEAKIILKSSGSIAQFIPDLIEIGVDVLSPLQPLASGMEPRELKRKFGNAVSFLGGFDIQGLLPFGDTEAIRNGVRLLIDECAPGGGYIFSASYVIQCNTPPENIVAMFDAADEYGAYPLHEQDEGTSYLDFLRTRKIRSV
jgi:uroporphyrinogen decarboxylase